MTNKEIIIGGVNVAKCNFLLERENKVLCECSHSTGFRIICECKNWTSCYYKQLAREKEKNTKLEELIRAMREDEENLLYELEVLYADKYALEIGKEKLCQTITELKKEEVEIKRYLGIKEKIILQRLEELQEFRDRDIDKLFSYKQALEFIKERISEQEKLGFDELIQLIENKVSEALNEN